MSNRLLFREIARELAVIPHPVTIIGGNRRPELTFIAKSATNGVGSPQTFLAQSFGAPVVGRLAIAVVHWIQAGNVRTISSATIGGNAATIAVQTTIATNPRVGVGIIYAQVDAGTTLDVVVTFSGSVDEATISSFRGVNQSSNTPNDTASATAGNGSTATNIDINQNGYLICAATSASDGNSITLNGSPNTSYDADDGSTRDAAGFGSLMTAEVNRAVGTTAGNNNIAFVAAAWS